MKKPVLMGMWITMINNGDGDLPPVIAPSVMLGTADKPCGQGALMG